MAEAERRQGPPRCLAQQQWSSGVNEGSMIFLQRPANVLHFEIIPQAEAIGLQPRLMFSGLSVKLFLLSAADESPWLAFPLPCCPTSSMVFKDRGCFYGFVKTTWLPSDCNVTHNTKCFKLEPLKIKKISNCVSWASILPTYLSFLLCLQWF